MGVVKKITKLTIKQKLEILNKLKNGETVKKICIDYKVNKSTVSRIKKNEVNINKFVRNTESGPGNRSTMKSAEYPKMEKALFNWFLNQRAKNVPISEEILKSKAHYFHNKIKENLGNFNASNGWMKNFKRRHGIRRLKICGEKLSNKPESVDPFVDQFKNKINELQLTADQIYNCDESGLFFRLLPNSTLVSSMEKAAPGRKTSKERITFLPCMNANGTHKLKLLVIGKSENPRAFKNFINNPVHYRGNKSAWMTYVIFKDWFKNVFVPEVTEFLQSKGLPIKALLLIDNAPCHPKENQLKSDDGNFVIMCLPPNCTAILQPLDQNAINLTKLYYKKNLLTYLIGIKGPDLEQKLKDFNIRMAVTILANAWDKVSPVAIKKCWAILMPGNEQWTEEDDLPLNTLREHILQEQVLLVPSIPTLLREVLPNVNLSVEDVNMWINEIVEDVNEDLCLSDDENSVHVEVDEIPKIKTDDVIKALNVCIDWATANDISIEKLVALQDIKDSAIKKKFKNSGVQTKISNFFH